MRVAIEHSLSRLNRILLAATCLLTSITAEMAAQTGPSAVQSFNVSSTTGAEQILHVPVGHLLFINAVTRVKRIYVANPTVLDSYTVSPKQIVITAKTAGLSAIVVWDETDKPETYLVSSDLDLDGVNRALKETFPDQDIHVEGAEGRVVLAGTVSTASISEAAGKLVSQFAKEAVNSLVVNTARLKQVKLQVRIVEVDRSRLNQFGVNIFAPGGAVIGGGTTAQFPTTANVESGALTLSSALNFLFYSSKINVGATVEDLETKQILQILAEPTIVTVSGQKASFLAGGEFPFPVVQSSAGVASVTIQFRPYGVKLEFTPEVNLDGSIFLKVAPEVSALDYTNSVEIDGYTIPAISTRRADTQVVLRSGQSFAISGLLDKRTTDSMSKTPGIANLPILGVLFKSKAVTRSTSELVVIVTPTVVEPLSETSTPNEPQPVRPFMDPALFDTGLPSSIRKP